jgi:hypothetical protein
VIKMHDDPTFLAALDRAVELTRVEHYRHLCLEHPSPKVRREYRGLVVKLAEGTYIGDTAGQVTDRSCCGGNPYGD